MGDTLARLREWFAPACEVHVLRSGIGALRGQNPLVYALCPSVAGIGTHPTTVSVCKRKTMTFQTAGYGMPRGLPLPRSYRVRNS